MQIINCLELASKLAFFCKKCKAILFQCLHLFRNKVVTLTRNQCNNETN